MSLPGWTQTPGYSVHTNSGRDVFQNNKSIQNSNKNQYLIPGMLDGLEVLPSVEFNMKLLMTYTRICCSPAALALHGKCSWPCRTEWGGTGHRSLRSGVGTATAHLQSQSERRGGGGGQKHSPKTAFYFRFNQSEVFTTFLELSSGEAVQRAWQLDLPSAFLIYWKVICKFKFRSP